MAIALQSWLKALPYNLQRELAGDIKTIADGLADDIRAEAPVKTGRLRDSVRVRRGRRTLELYVEAGGDATSHAIRPGVSGVSYDYALGIEYGNSRMSAQPFFYSTYRARYADVHREIEDAVARAVATA